MVSDDDFLYFVDEALDGMAGILVELGDDLANRRPDSPRRSRRQTSRRPVHVASTAQTLLSTRPRGRATSLTTASVMSVSTPEERLGQAIQRPPSG